MILHEFHVCHKVIMHGILKRNSGSSVIVERVLPVGDTIWQPLLMVFFVGLVQYCTVHNTSIMYHVHFNPSTLHESTLESSPRANNATNSKE